MEEYSIGEYIIYRNGEKYELGRIKSLCEDGAFVAYHDGETGAKTPYSHMHKLINRYCIKDTSLGGDYFKADTPQMDAEIPKNGLRSDCTGCRFVGAYDTEFPCANCVRKNKDYYSAEQTERSGDEQN